MSEFPHGGHAYVLPGNLKAFRATDNLREQWTVNLKLALLDEIERLRAKVECLLAEKSIDSGDYVTRLRGPTNEQLETALAAIVEAEAMRGMYEYGSKQWRRFDENLNNAIDAAAKLLPEKTP